MRVSLIGHGRLGKLISGFLSRDVELEIFDQSIEGTPRKRWQVSENFL